MNFWTRVRIIVSIRSLRALALAGLALPLNSEANDWSFVWVGATARGWTVVQGAAAPKLGKDEIHFDLIGTNSVKYTVDAQLGKDGDAEAGLAALGDAYSGITIMKGRFIKKTVGSGCQLEALQVQNEFNSLSVGRFAGPGCIPQRP